MAKYKITTTYPTKGGEDFKEFDLEAESVHPDDVTPTYIFSNEDGDVLASVPLSSVLFIQRVEE